MESDRLDRDQLLAELEKAQSRLEELQAAEKALRNERDLIRMLIDYLPDYIYAKDREGRLIIANRAVANQLGFASPQQVVGKTDFDLFSAELAGRYRSEETSILESGQGLFDHEGPTVDANKDPRERWVSTTKVPFRDGEGRTVGFFGVGRDITERRKSEQERQRLQAMLQQAQKLEAVGRLAGGVAHEFNNILTGIMGFSNLLLTQTDASDQRRSLIERIEAASRRAAEIVQRLLVFSRRQQSTRRVVDLNEILRDGLELLRPMIGEKYEIQASPCAETVPVLADSVQLGQVLLSLASNARDAMPGGGVIRLSVTNERVEAPPAGRGLPAGNYGHLSFTDAGSGMDAQTKARLFEPFFTTKEVGKGPGLGLSTVWGIVEEHHGFVTVESEPGRGSTFHVYLPVVSLAERPAETAEEIPPATGSETIFVAEDDAMVRGLIRAILKGHGYTVIEAVDGEDALRRFRECESRVDLSLLDVVMPKMNGRAVAREMRALRPDLKILFMSGYAPENVGGGADLLDECSFLVKPFTAPQLTEEIRKVLDL